MSNADIERLKYRPDIEIPKEIHTRYDGEIDVYSHSEANQETIYTKDPYENTAPVLKRCLDDNIGTVLKDGISKLKDIEKQLFNLKNEISKDSTFAELLDGLESGDLNSLDKYISLSDNISGEIYKEVYPILLNTYKDFKRFIDYINEKLFNNSIDYDNIDSFIDLYNKSISNVIDLEKRILSKEDKRYIDYKMFSVDMQLYKAIENRINIIVDFAERLINREGTEIVFIPPEPTLLIDYFDSTYIDYSTDLEKMHSFDSTDVVYTLIDKIYNQRQKVKRNRDLLLNADRKSFFSMLPMAKSVEEQLDDYILDLYKANICDTINKNDYLNSLFLKNSLRDYIKKSFKR